MYVPPPSMDKTVNTPKPATSANLKGGESALINSVRLKVKQQLIESLKWDDSHAISITPSA